MIIQMMTIEQERYNLLLKLLQSGGQAQPGAALPALPSGGDQPSVGQPSGAPEAEAAAKVKESPAVAVVTGHVQARSGVLQDAYVYLDQVRGAPARGRTLEIKQKDKQFSPQVAVVQRGTSVVFPNLDAVYHDVFSTSGRNSFDLGAYRAGETPRSVVLGTPGVVDVFCNIHSRMNASILVLPSALYAKVGADGNFRMENVPVGHPQAGRLEPDHKAGTGKGRRHGRGRPGELHPRGAALVGASQQARSALRIVQGITGSACWAEEQRIMDTRRRATVGFLLSVAGRPGHRDPRRPRAGKPPRGRPAGGRHRRRRRRRADPSRRRAGRRDAPAGERRWRARCRFRSCGRRWPIASTPRRSRICSTARIGGRPTSGATPPSSPAVNCSPCTATRSCRFPSGSSREPLTPPSLPACSWARGRSPRRWRPSRWRTGQSRPRSCWRRRSTSPPSRASWAPRWLSPTATGSSPRPETPRRRAIFAALAGKEGAGQYLSQPTGQLAVVAPASASVWAWTLTAIPAPAPAGRGANPEIWLGLAGLFGVSALLFGRARARQRRAASSRWRQPGRPPFSGT